MSDEDEDLFGDYEKGEEEDGDLEENTTLVRNCCSTASSVL